MIPTRIVLVGDRGVGKTSLLNRFLLDKHDPTVAIAPPSFISPERTETVLNRFDMSRDIPGKRKYKIEFRDTSGDLNY